MEEVSDFEIIGGLEMRVPGGVVRFGAGQVTWPTFHCWEVAGSRRMMESEKGCCLVVRLLGDGDREPLSARSAIANAIFLSECDSWGGDVEFGGRPDM